MQYDQEIHVRTKRYMRGCLASSTIGVKAKS